MAQELVPVLSHVGFRCVVMDDREEFANREVFPEAAGTIVGNLEEIGSYIDIRPCDYVCVMTRGHQFDYYVQRQVLSMKPGYIGIMGSRNKIRVVTDKLLADGFTSKKDLLRDPGLHRSMFANGLSTVISGFFGSTPNTEEIEACHMPIGTDIRAETPAEIAISIAGG